MSSNIRVNRVCQHCGSDFIAKTTTTQYCSHRCSRAAYKRRLKNEKIRESNKETFTIKATALDNVKIKDFLTVNEVAALLSCSRRTAYRLISSGVIPSVNLLERKTIVRRADIDSLFEKGTKEPIAKDLQTAQVKDYDIEQCYSLKEIADKYNVNDRLIHTLIKRHNLPKIKRGWYAYVPKKLVDKVFSVNKREK